MPRSANETVMQELNVTASYSTFVSSLEIIRARVLDGAVTYQEFRDCNCYAVPACDIESTLGSVTWVASMNAKTN